MRGAPGLMVRNYANCTVVAADVVFKVHQFVGWVQVYLREVAAAMSDAT